MSAVWNRFDFDCLGNNRITWVQLSQNNLDRPISRSTYSKLILLYTWINLEIMNLYPFRNYLVYWYVTKKNMKIFGSIGFACVNTLILTLWQNKVIFQIKVRILGIFIYVTKKSEISTYNIMIEYEIIIYNRVTISLI